MLKTLFTRTNFTQRFLVIFAITLLSGCATHVNVLQTLSEETVLSAEQGIVVARVINASNYPLPFNRLTITPENVNESSSVKPDRLFAAPSQTKGSTVFSSPVNAGSYALSSIWSFHSTGDFWYSKYATSDATFGTFEVKPGEVTDLGTIIYYPKSLGDKYQEVLLRSPNPQQGEVLEKYFPFFSITPQRIHGWNNDDREQERESLYASVAQNPSSYSDRYLAPDGSVYFLSKLGVIIKRTAEGDWELDAVDTDLELTAIAQNLQGDLVVSSSEGQIFIKKVGRDWQSVPLDEMYAIDALLFSSENNVDIIARQQTQLSIFRGDISQQNVLWKKLNGYNSLSGWESSPLSEIEGKAKPPKKRKITSIRLSEIAGKHQLAVNTIPSYADPVFARAKTKTFNFSPDSWETQLLESEQDISAIIDAGAIKLGIKFAGFWSWDGKDTYLKLDNTTNSWQEINTHVYRCDGKITTDKTCGGKSIKSKRSSFTFRSAPLFINEQEGIAIVTFSSYDFWTGKSSSDINILKTADGGQSWSDTTYQTPKDYCTSLVPEVSDRLLISCNGASTDFYESFDNGSTWDHVRQHENF